jgi:hypothetical protein
MNDEHTHPLNDPSRLTGPAGRTGDPRR